MYSANAVGIILGTSKSEYVRQITARSEGENGESFPSYGHALYKLVIHSFKCYGFGVVYGDRLVGAVTKQYQIRVTRRGTQQ